MEVILAETYGMCFGVKGALAITEQVASSQLISPQNVTIYGELVHNPIVLERLDDAGFERQSESLRDAIPATETVLITAHGISDARRAELLRAGKKLIDTTCPLVTRMHRAAQQLAADGYHVLIIGRRGHVEVHGIVEDLAAFDVVEHEDDVRDFGAAQLGIVVQTTVPVARSRELYDLISLYNQTAEIRFIDTICDPTKQRISAVEQLVEKVDVLVVVGGRNSNNTRQLAEIGHRRGLPTYSIESATDLRVDWFARAERVGLTAGTSTLDESIQAVRQAILSFAPLPSYSSPNTGTRVDVRQPVPGHRTQSK